MSRRAPLLDTRAGARLLGERDLERVLRLCASDPVGTVLMSSRVQAAVQDGLRGAGGEVWGYEQDGTLVAAAWSGANLVPFVADVDRATRARALDALADLGRGRGRWCSSIVGPAEATLGLWERLSRTWSTAREVREDQPSMLIDDAPRVEPDALVRRTGADDYDVLLPACVRMFTEEVGYSPVAGGGGAYERRVRQLVAAGRSYARIEAPRGWGRPEPRVVFKAEIGASALGVAQVQGVWVTPERRGQGLSEPGMAAVVHAVRAGGTPAVSLYANAYNTRAVAAYRRVGFRQVGTYATVLF